MKNVRQKKCQHNKCNKRATFRFIGKTPISCGTHHLDGMIGVNVTTTNRCKHNDCNKQSSFGFKGNK